MKYRAHRCSDAGFTAIAAHRGGAKQWPENSVEALAGSIALSVDAVEFDVHLSRDDEVMVFHDPTLDRTTGSKGPLRNHNAVDLQSILLHRSECGIPTCSSWTKQLAAKEIAVSLEVKSDVEGNYYPGIEEKCLKLLEESRTLDDALVHSFDFAVLRQFRELHKGVFLAANVDGRSLKEAGSFSALLDEVLSLDAGNLNVDFNIMTPARLAQAHSAGLSVTLWTVDADADLTFWLRAGVDAIATDRPERALELRNVLQRR